jgi:hypothetical protein
MAFHNKNDEQLGIQNHPVTLAGFMGEMRKQKPTKKGDSLEKKLLQKFRPDLRIESFL